MYLTPDEIGDNQPIYFEIGQDMLPYVIGALSELAQELNWEAFGTITPFEASQYFKDLTARIPENMPQGTLEAVKVRSSVNVNISAGVWTSLNFDVEDYDDLGMHSSGNPSRLNAINNGDYLVIGQVGIQQGTGYFSVRILLNGTTELAHVIEQSATHDRSQNAVGRARLQAGDYVEIQVNSATALVLPASYLFFAMDRLK